MQNPNTFTFKPDTHYVVDLNAALNFPEFFNPDANLPERHIIISRIYQKSLHKMRDENTDRGTTSNELADFLYNIITHGRKTKNDGAEEYHLGNLHVIFDWQDHNYTGRQISGEHIKDTIALAEYWSTQSTIRDVTILTNDPIVQISAQDKPDLDICMFLPTPYSGYRRIRDDDAISYWRKCKKMPLETWLEFQPDAPPLRPHEFILFGKTNVFSHIGRYDAFNETIVPLSYYRDVNGISPIGELQAMAFEALMAPADEISVVILYGTAGSGKTFATIAAGLTQTGLAYGRFIDHLNGSNKTTRANGKKARKQSAEQDSVTFIPEDDDHPYQSIELCLPDQKLGDKMPAVPGDERAKLYGRTYPIRDNICAYLRVHGDKKEGGFPLTERDINARTNSIMEQIGLVSPGEINGRSFWNTFLFCDEAQFNSLSQLKAFIERCDIGTKLVICGDPSQINNPFSSHGNSLSRIIRYLSDDPNVAIVRFDDDNEIKRPGSRIVARSFPRSR